jgi:RND family efflux transporter MFP subunit
MLALKKARETLMNLTRITGLFQRLRLPVLVTVIVAAVGVLAVAVWSMTKDYGDKGGEFVLYRVANSDLPIVVTERGNLEAQLDTPIRCEVESLTRDSSGNYGTQIIFIVPNGSAVKEGDLLVELDSAALREKLDSQILSHQKAVSASTQANAKYDNQILMNQTNEAEAELKVKLAKLEHEMYLDKDKGTYRLAVDEIERDISDQTNIILEKEAQAKLAQIEMAGIRKLFNLGYRSTTDLEEVRLKLMQAQDAVASATNNVNSAKAKQGKLQSYERDMQELSLAGAVETAIRQEKQVKNNSTSQLAQVEATKIEAESWEAKEKERLNNYQDQLTKCKIFAPHGGMVVYAREGRDGATEIAEGVNVRERQRIMSLPDLSRMQVKTQVHEAVLDQVRPGLPATIRVDAFPDQVYYGFMYEVAVVPSSSGWYSSGVKTYDCVVRIDGEVTNLKPGMTAVVEIHVDRLKGILTVPVQAIIQRDRENWCYVQAGSQVGKRTVKIGRSNDKFVEIQEGLVQGENIVLNPMSILEKTESGDKTISPESGAPEMPDAVAESMKRQHAATLAENRKPKGDEPVGESPDGEMRKDGPRPERGMGPPRKGGRRKSDEAAAGPSIQAGGG